MDTLPVGNALQGCGGRSRRRHRDRPAPNRYLIIGTLRSAAPYPRLMKITRGIAVAILATVALAGCTSSPVSPPAATSAPGRATETPKPASDTTVAAMVVSGSGVTTNNAAGDLLHSQPYSAGSAAMIAFLTDALGAAPKSTAVANQECIKPSSEQYWGAMNDGVAVRIPADPAPPLFDWVVEVRGQSVGPVAIRSSAGFAIGDDTTAIVAGLPAAQTVGLHDPFPESSGDTSQFVFDLVETIPMSGKSIAYGGAALSDGDKAAIIVAPADVSRLGC